MPVSRHACDPAIHELRSAGAGSTGGGVSTNHPQWRVAGFHPAIALRGEKEVMARPQEFDTARVLHKALELFWRKGYEATSLADLMAATRLSKSSLYAAFGGKRDLFLAAFDAYRAERTVGLHRILASGPAREGIATFFRDIIATGNKSRSPYGCMSTNQAVELAPHDSAVRDRITADFQTIEDAFARTIERGQAEGSVAPAKDARSIARLFVVAFPGFQVMIRAGADPARLEAALQGLLSLLDEAAPATASPRRHPAH
jgi:TetR/AcrR family transcriptional regulator, transcriptional repressor for nem operon